MNPQIARVRILSALKLAPMSSHDLAKCLDIPINTVQVTLNRLSHRRVITVCGRAEKPERRCGCAANMWTRRSR